jgi:hypothetical protein
VRRSSIVGRVITNVAQSISSYCRSVPNVSWPRLRNCDGNAEALFDCV